MFNTKIPDDFFRLGNDCDSGNGRNDSTLSLSDIIFLIWINGGPTCSSMNGMFLYNVPFRSQPNTTTKTKIPYPPPLLLKI